VEKKLGKNKKKRLKRKIYGTKDIEESEILKANRRESERG
jgi:hypothetical protein